MAQPVITADNLAKDFAGEQAVRDVSFSVPAGGLFGLVGADGAGKTTLLRLLSTLISPDSGNASVLGRSIRSDVRYLRSNIGYMPQRFSLYADLSVMENLDFFADVFGVAGKKRKERIERLLDFSRLAQFVRRAAGKLSGGMKQKLALCCALVHTPRLLLLDEPTIGVDPVSRREFWEILASLKRDGVSMVLSTPYMDEAGWCDEVLFMHHGKRLLQGRPDALIAGFDRTIYRVAGDEDTATLYCKSTTSFPEEIERVYPSGGALHVIARRSQNDPQRILGLMREQVAGARTIERVVPGMEDLFFHHLASQREERRHAGEALN